jgi:hypothetical protein
MMRQTMDGQAEALAGILADEAPVIAAAERLRGRRVLAIGTGTSWHAASQAAALLRAAGLDAWAAQSADAAVDGPLPGQDGALRVFTHTGAKRYTAQATQRARSGSAEIVQVCGVGVEGADLVTVPRERSSAYTASHLGALLRAAQLARALGADLPGLGEVPAAAEHAYRVPTDQRPAPPARLVEFIGGGINQWTAAEGALKMRESTGDRRESQEDLSSYPDRSWCQTGRHFAAGAAPATHRTAHGTDECDQSYAGIAARRQRLHCHSALGATAAPRTPRQDSFRHKRAQGKNLSGHRKPSDATTRRRRTWVSARRPAAKYKNHLKFLIGDPVPVT